MKTLWIYVIIGSAAFAIGATAGIVGKRLLGATNTVYVGELEELDIGELMEKYEKNPTATFTPAEMVNISLEKYRRCEYSYSVSVGTAHTVVEQSIRNYQIRNKDNYFEESISFSKFVDLANRMMQSGKGDDIDFYGGKSSSSDTGVYPATPTVYTQEDYKKFLGRTLEDMFIYVISNSTVIKDGTKSEVTSDGYKVTLNLNPNTSTYYYKIQMKNISKLDALPIFEYVKLTYTMTKDYELKHLSVDEKYQASMGFTVPITNSLETDYYPNAKKDIPALDEKLDYTLRGE